MRQRLARIFTVLALISGSVLIAAAPAQAAYSSCPSGAVCGFDSQNGNGTMWAYTGTSGGGVCLNVIDDRFESYKNNHNKAVSFYWLDGCTPSSHSQWGPRASGSSGNFPCISGGHPGPCWTSGNHARSIFIHTGSSLGAVDVRM